VLHGDPWTLRLRPPLSLQEDLAALQARRANHPHKASHSVISFLPKEAWWSPASLSPICSRGAWVSHRTPYSYWSRWARIPFVAFVPLATRGAHFPLVPILARRPNRSRGSRKPQGPWDPIFAYGSRGATFTRGPLLACRANRAWASALAGKPNASCRAQWPPLPRGAVGSNRAQGAFVTL